MVTLGYAHRLSLFFRMGAGPYDFKSLSQEIDLFTGGLSTNPHLSAHLTSPNEYEQVSSFGAYNITWCERNGMNE